MGPLDLEVGLGQFWGGGPHWGFSIPCSPFLPPPSSIHNLLCNKVLVPLLQYFSTLQCLHAIAFLLSESSPFKHKSSRQRERERAVDRRPFALAFASPINLKRLRTAWQLRHSVRQQMLVPKIPRKLQSFHKFVQTLKFSNDQLCADKDADNDWDDGDVNRWGGRAQWAQ